MTCWSFWLPRVFDLMHPSCQPNNVCKQGFMQTNVFFVSYLFRASQIDQVEFATLCSTGVDILLRDSDDENGMTSWTFGIHVWKGTSKRSEDRVDNSNPVDPLTRIGNHTIVSTTTHYFVYFFAWSNVDFEQVLDVDTLLFIFMDRQVLSWSYKKTS